MYKLADNVLYNKDDEMNQEFLIDIDDGSIYYLNQMAATLIVYLNENKTIEDYVDYIYEAVGKTVGKDVIKKDALGYINQLLEQDMICEV